MKQDKFKPVLEGLAKIFKQCFKGRKLKYPIAIIESLQQLENDLGVVKKLIELYDDDIAKRKSGTQINPKNSEIRDRLIAVALNKTKLPTREDVIGNNEDVASDTKAS
jgi:hypothetical protein